MLDAVAPGSAPVVVTGSHNWSLAAETVNDENTLVIHDAGIALLYKAEFEKRWSETVTATQAPAFRQVSAFPNPVSDVLQLQFGSVQDAEISVRDLLGKTVLQTSVAGRNQVALAVENLLPGFYFAVIESRHGLATVSFRKASVAQEGAAHPVGTDAVLLGAWAGVGQCTRLLDIGTGTGVVALMLAQRCAARITAVEIHPASAALARANFAASPWANRLELVESSIQEFAGQTAVRFDLIVSNPPFFPKPPFRPMPRGAWDGTTHHCRRNIAVVRQTTADRNGAILCRSAGAGRQALCEIAVTNGLYCTEETEVRGRPKKPVERLLLCFERNPYPFVRKQMSIYGTGTTRVHHSGDDRGVLFVRGAKHGGRVIETTFC